MGTSTLARPRYDDVRFQSGIATPAEVARLAKMPASTVYSWFRETTTRGAVVHRIEPQRRGWPSVPLVGIVEAFSLRQLRQVGVPMGQLAAAAKFFQEKHDDPYALAGQVFTDGIDYYLGEMGELFRMQDGQVPIPEVVQEHLRVVKFAQDGHAEAFKVFLTRGVILEIDPRYNAGRLSLPDSRVPAFAISGALAGGDRPEEVADDYGLELDEVLAVGEAPGETAAIF